MQKSQNSALASILEDRFGGGPTWFNLPDLRGRVPVGIGEGAQSSALVMGQTGGTPSTTITLENMPSHNHLVLPPAMKQPGNTASPDGAYPAVAPATSSGHPVVTVSSYHSANVPFDGNMAPYSTNSAGKSQPLPTMSPYLGLNYIICTQGIYPPRQ